MKKVLNWIFGIFLLMSLIFNGILGCLNHRYKNTPPEKIEIRDSFFIPKDSIITKVKWKTKFDTIIDLLVKDSIIQDTIEIPIEHRVDSFTIKKDSLNITEKIHHSGFKSVVDSVELDYSFNYEITKPKLKKIGLVWCVGPYIGYGINFNNGQYYFSPEVGVGASIGIGGIIK